MQVSSKVWAATLNGRSKAWSDLAKEAILYQELERQTSLEMSRSVSHCLQRRKMLQRLPMGCPSPVARMFRVQTLAQQHSKTPSHRLGCSSKLQQGLSVQAIHTSLSHSHTTHLTLQTTSVLGWPHWTSRSRTCSSRNNRYFRMLLEGIPINHLPCRTQDYRP